MSYARKSERAAIAAHNPRYALALRIASRAFNGPQFEEDADGRRIRIWGNGYEDYVTDDDVRAWLKGLRVVEDLRDGLEFVRQGYIDTMVAKGWLRRGESGWWVTAACAEKFQLPRVMGTAFPR